MFYIGLFTWMSPARALPQPQAILSSLFSMRGSFTLFDTPSQRSSKATAMT